MKPARKTAKLNIELEYTKERYDFSSHTSRSYVHDVMAIFKGDVYGSQWIVREEQNISDDEIEKQLTRRVLLNIAEKIEWEPS